MSVTTTDRAGPRLDSVRRTRFGGARLAAMAVAGAIGAVGPAVLAPAALAKTAEPSESAPAAASGAVPLLDASTYASLTPRQQQAVDELTAMYGDEILIGVEPPGSMGASAAPGVAGWFAQELFSWGFGIGLDLGFGPLARALGFGPDTAALDQINQSLTELHAKIDDIQGQLEALADAVVWNEFAEAHGEAEEEANEIFEQSREIANWEVLEADPPQSTVDRLATDTNDALVDLGPRLLTQAGTGAIPALVRLEVNATPVSDTEEQWDRLLTVVDAYRSAYAQGVMNLLWAAQYDEANGTAWGVTAETRVETATDRIEMVYDYIGAPYPQRPGDDQKWVHANGSDEAMASTTREPYRGEESEPLITQSSAHPIFLGLAGYRPQDGTTLQRYLTDRGFTHTTITYADRYGYDRRCPWNCIYSVYNHQGVVNGNSYEVRKNVYWEFSSSRHPDDVYNDVIRPNIESNQQFLRDNPRIASIDVPVSANTGMPALMDDESIRAERDGLEDFELERGDGTAVSVSFANSGRYETLQIARPESDDVLESIDLSEFAGGPVGEFDAPDGALELRLGFAVDGDVSIQDTRATSVVTANPDQSSIALDAIVVVPGEPAHFRANGSSINFLSHVSGSGQINVGSSGGGLASDVARVTARPAGGRVMSFVITDLTFDLDEDGGLANADYTAHYEPGFDDPHRPVTSLEGSFNHDNGRLRLDLRSSANDFSTMIFQVES